MIESVRLDGEGKSLVILDQTVLPNETVYLNLTTREEIYDAIRQLKVRGAPAIGIAAAYGLYVIMRQAADSGKAGEAGINAAGFLRELRRVKSYLASSRPTAVNLFWALGRMETRAAAESRKSPSAILGALKEEADALKREDAEVCRQIGENGLTLLEDGWGVLTHCNAGSIATARYGTALAPLYLGQERGMRFSVYADETRPLLQGARLTTWELAESGIDVTLICDNMASAVMKLGRIQAVLVGCDRVAANGDTANKIGTSGLAVLAKHYGVPFYVFAPLSTIDRQCLNGGGIEIELRPPEEVTERWYVKPMAHAKAKVYNPAFDVTDADLISAIVTEKGIIRQPYAETIARLFR